MRLYAIVYLYRFGVKLYSYWSCWTVTFLVSPAQMIRYPTPKTNGRRLYQPSLLFLGKDIKYLNFTSTKKYSWFRIFSPTYHLNLFQNLCRKLSNDDVMESSYKLNLILTVLLKLFTILPNDKIKELKQEDLEAELLTYCIRRSSNPESR